MSCYKSLLKNYGKKFSVIIFFVILITGSWGNDTGIRTQKALAQSDAIYQQLRLKAPAVQAPVTAKLLVVCVSFKGIPATKSLSVYQHLYFGKSHSVASYYHAVSYGQLQVTGRVVGDPLHPGKFLPLPHSESYYAKTDNGSGGNFPNNDDGIVSDVISQLVKDHFNFNPYVSHGTLPYLAIVFSGYGADVEPNNKSLIWPVESNLQYPIVVPLNDHAKVKRLVGGSAKSTSLPSNTALVSNYDLVPELDDSSGAATTLGVLAHEFGHLLGLLDLYDVSSSQNAGQGIGPFSLMGTGNWNGYPSGAQPAGLDPFSLQYLGWLQPIAITESETGVPLPPLEKAPVVYRINPVNFSGEYFLLSNEQAQGTDVALPDTGVFIWRIDANAVLGSSYDWLNNVLNSPSLNHTHHYDVAIISAGNANDLTQPEGSVAGYNDAYPSVSGNNRFTSKSKPSNVLWNGQFLGMNITNIAINPVTKWASFDVQDVQHGTSLVIARPKTGLTVRVGQPVKLTALYTQNGITQDISADVQWSGGSGIRIKGREAVFSNPGLNVVHVAYGGLFALAYFTVIK